MQAQSAGLMKSLLKWRLKTYFTLGLNFSFSRQVMRKLREVGSTKVEIGFFFNLGPSNHCEDANLNVMQSCIDTQDCNIFPCNLTMYYQILSDIMYYTHVVPNSLSFIDLGVLKPSLQSALHIDEGELHNLVFHDRGVTHQSNWRNSIDRVQMNKRWRDILPPRNAKKLLSLWGPSQTPFLIPSFYQPHSLCRWGFPDKIPARSAVTLSQTLFQDSSAHDIKRPCFQVLGSKPKHAK